MVHTQVRKNDEEKKDTFVHEDGDIYVDGKIVGSVIENGEIYSKEGYRIGSINDDGDVYKGCYRVGTIANDGRIYVDGLIGGRYDGNVSSSPKKKAGVAIAMFFDKTEE